MRTRVILAGKRDSRRHSTSGFSENVAEVTETSYEMLKVLLFCDEEKAYYYLHFEANRLLPPSVKSQC